MLHYQSKLLSLEELYQRCTIEDIQNTGRLSVQSPCWVESAPLHPLDTSFLVRPDLIMRGRPLSFDGENPAMTRSCVYIDVHMSNESYSLAQTHMAGWTNNEEIPWEKYLRTIAFFPRTPPQLHLIQGGLPD